MGLIRSFFLLICGGAIIITSPVWLAITTNEIRAGALLNRLRSVEIPADALVSGGSSRVFNSGNGDGCDFEAKLSINYKGRMANLTEAFHKFLENTYSGNEIYISPTDDTDKWSAKVMGMTTEIYVSRLPNQPVKVKIMETPREEGMDIRCW